jgi:hypothetical protein
MLVPRPANRSGRPFLPLRPPERASRRREPARPRGSHQRVPVEFRSTLPVARSEDACTSVTRRLHRSLVTPWSRCLIGKRLCPTRWLRRSPPAARLRARLPAARSAVSDRRAEWCRLRPGRGSRPRSCPRCENTRWYSLIGRIAGGEPEPAGAERAAPPRSRRRAGQLVQALVAERDRGACRAAGPGPLLGGLA